MSAELRRRELIAPLERYAELAGAVVADRGGNIYDGERALVQQLGGTLHALFQQILMDRASVGLAEAVLERGRGDAEPRGELVDGQRFRQMRYHVFLHAADGIGHITVAECAFRREGEQRTAARDEIEQLGGFVYAVIAAFPFGNRLQSGKKVVDPGGAVQHDAAVVRAQTGFEPCRVDRQGVRNGKRGAVLNGDKLTAEQSVSNRNMLHTAAAEQQHLVLPQEHLSSVWESQAQSAAAAEQHLASRRIG